MKDPKQLVKSQKSFFESGKTRDISFIKRRLQRLKESIIKNEDVIHQALYKDFKKPKFEAYIKQCLNIDMAPTILDMAGVEIPGYMQGDSMLNLLNGGSGDKWRTSILFEYYLDTYWPYAGPNQIAVRTDRYKLVDAFLKNDIDELYDLKNDPGEMVNLINSEAHDAIELNLRQEAKNLKAQFKYKADRDWWLRKVLKEKNIKKIFIITFKIILTIP